MGLLTDLSEKFLVKNRGSQEEIHVDDSMPKSLTEANFQELATFLSKVKTSNKTRNRVLSELEEMSFDSIIAAAMELVTDDATQVDPVRGVSVWVESDDKNLEKTLNQFLHDIKIEDKIWLYTYNIVKYGELYLKTYHSDFQVGTNPKELEGLEGYIYERVEDLRTVAELVKYDMCVGYYEQSEDKKKHRLCPKEDYIHFINDRYGKREKINIEYIKDNKKVEDWFKIRYGTALYEAARQAWLMVDLIENLIIYVRFGRSAFYRLVKVEVGGSSRNEVIRILREIKSAFSVEDSININERTYTGIKKPIPHGENVYLPVKQGKGDVNVEQVGGDTDIGEIVDLDYWRNKLFAALKVPKAYLGFEETQPGGLGNISLTRQDIRYARSVKMVKRVMINGITDMCNFHLQEVGNWDENVDFKVCMTKVMSAEESDIGDQMMASIALADALKNLLTDTDVNVRTITRVIIRDILDLSDKFPELFEEDKDGETKN